MKVFKRMLCLVLSLVMVFSVTSMVGAESDTAAVNTDEVTASPRKIFSQQRVRKSIIRKAKKYSSKA